MKIVEIVPRARTKLYGRACARYGVLVDGERQ